ncbi:hypothetical protein ACQP0C_09960 [Nocardia sp. CA-129566]|uniref:hypothetical protein n=1 Tax=Nocardia sp. CA-129566 TaxID=3239976 RepID=UPI003D964F72
MAVPIGAPPIMPRFEHHQHERKIGHIQELIRRQPHPTDRRAKQIVLTAAGERRRAEALDLLGTQSPLTSLTAAQQETLRDLLHAMMSPDSLV